MTPSPLPPDLFLRIKRLMLPHVTSPTEQETLLTDAFYLTEPRLFAQIRRGDDANTFATLCLKTLFDFGCPFENTHSVALLLEALRFYCGVQQHRDIDEIVLIVNAICAQPPPAQEEPPPTAPPSESPQTITTPAEKRTPTVFISYSHRDREAAERLIGVIQQAGHACWIDQSKIPGGADWKESIREGINNSYAMVVVCSHPALESGYVWDEILWAREKKKLIVPVLLEDLTGDDIFFGLHRYQAVALYRDEAAALDELVAALPQPQIASEAAPAPVVRNRRALELAYLDRLRFEEFNLEQFSRAQYTALGGEAQTHTRPADTLTFKPLTARQEFELIEHQGEREALLERQPFEDAVGKIEELRRVAVLGEPGAGKTTTLRAVAKPLVEAALRDPGAPIPLLIKLGNWTDERQPFATFVAAELGELGAHLDALLSEKRALLLFDGLNELPSAQRSAKYPQVETFVKAQPEAMAVITCREQDYTVALNFDQIIIRPLDALRIREFCVRALDEDAGSKLFWRLAGGEAIRQVWEKWERAGAAFKLFWEAADIPHDRPERICCDQRG